MGSLSRYRKAGIYFFIGIVLTLIAVGAVKHQAVYDQLYDWKLIPRPERLTELYFTSHHKLPQTYKSGQTQTITFTTHNLEYRTTTYSYTITQKNTSGKAKQLAHGTYTLRHDAHRTIAARVKLADLGKRTKIDITVTYQGIAFGQDSPSTQEQSVYYWVSKQEAQQ